MIKNTLLYYFHILVMDYNKVDKFTPVRGLDAKLWNTIAVHI